MVGVSGPCVFGFFLIGGANEYYAGAMSFSARLENDTRVHAEERFYRAQDNKTLLNLLNRLWIQALQPSRGVRIRKVSVTGA